MKQQLKRHQRKTKTTAVLSALALLINLQTAHAEQTMQFNIPAQPLSSALTRFSADTRLQVLYEGTIPII